MTINITMTEADFSNKELGPSGAQILAAFIERKFFQDNGALAKLDISSNYRNWSSGPDSKGSEDFIRPIAGMLKTNRSIKEINLAGNNLNAEAARIFSQDIQDNGALAKLDLSGNNEYSRRSPDFIRPIATMLKTNKTIKEINLAGNELKAPGLKALSQALKGSKISVLNISDNQLSYNEDSTGFDFSGITQFCEDIHAMGALAKLTWSGESYLEGGELKDAPPVTLDMDIVEADFSNKHLGVSGAIILAAFIKRKSFQDNGALVSLSLANNNLGAEGAQHLAKVLPTW